ncbi:MAG: hypothetical protein J7L66_05960 [Anaerolineaceae bacterium]|nr:hypothetical protein [Anaerolineaceae bacterium]
MPYTIMLITLVAMPMLVLSSEVARMMFVDVHLQAATDAACAAASQGVDLPHFIATGELKIDPSTAAVNAQREFNSSVQNAGINQYSPSLSRLSISGLTTVYCHGSASMTWMLPGIAPVILTADSAAEARAVH